MWVCVCVTVSVYVVVVWQGPMEEQFLYWMDFTLYKYIWKKKKSYAVYLTITAYQWVTRPLKTESYHDANHAATDDTVGRQGDNPWCHQSRHHQCYHGISRSSVTLFI